MQEIWKDIPWYEWMYQASNLWSIRSLTRLVKWKEKYFQKIIGRKLKQKFDKHTWYYCLDLSKDGKRKTCSVHRLIAKTFLWMKVWVVDHIDNNKKNNNVENLQFVDQTSNLSKFYVKKDLLIRWLKKLYQYKNMKEEEFIKKWLELML